MNRILLIAVVIFVMNFAPRVFANQFIPGEQLEVMAKAEIEEILDRQGEFRRREISLMRQIPAINLPNGVIGIKLTIPSAIVNYTGTTPVQARISIDGKMYRDVNFMMQVKIFDSVLIATHDLKIEVPVVTSDFRLEEVPVDGRSDYLNDVQEIVGLVPVRLIRAGVPVLVNYFQQPMVLTTGQPVKIIVRYKGLEVSANGTTMTRGRVGEIIKVKNDASKKIISARVVDDHTVEVIY